MVSMHALESFTGRFWKVLDAAGCICVVSMHRYCVQQSKPTCSFFSCKPDFKEIQEFTVHHGMQTVERYAGMYLDGLPATNDTLKALETAFVQRKQQWRDFAVASALQLFAERNFQSPAFEKEAVGWFEGQFARDTHRSGSGLLRPSLVGALSRIRQLWLLHGHDSFPQYSDVLQNAILKAPVVRFRPCP